MKLLHKTLRLYLIFSVTIFIFSIPVFYILIQNLWITDVDESLIYQKEKIIEGLKTVSTDPAKLDEFTKNAEKFDMGIYIFPLEKVHIQADSLYNNNYFDSTRQHREPFRELTAYITVDGKSYKIIVRKDLVESADLITEILLTQIILFLLLSAGMFIFNSYFSKKTWQPFYTIVSKLKLFRIDRQEPIAAPKTNIIEFKELGEAIQKLTENDIRIFRSQKEFTENAAHEIQTPLAVIKSQIDLITQDAEITLNQSEIITRIDKNIRILTKLNRNLLFLAKIENEQYDRNISVNVSVIVCEICSAFEEQMKLKKITLTQTIESDIYLSSSIYLLNSLITNLLTNSIRYNIFQGRVEVKLTKEFLMISNTGSDQPLDENKIYKRFYKTDSQSTSSGLGLAIAKKICETLNYTIHYQYINPNIHSFKVNF